MIAAGRPPSLTPTAVSRVVCKYFNFKNVFRDSVKTLPSYDDRNYFFRGESLSEECSEFTLKLNNPVCTSFGVVKGLDEAMIHLKSCGLSFSASCPLPCRSGEHVIQLTASELTAEDCVSVAQGASATNEENVKAHSTSVAEEDMKYGVHVLTFLSGQEFDNIEKKYMTTSLLYDIGEMVGRCDKELKVRYS